MTLKTFKNFIATIINMQKLCSKFDDGMETILNMPFIKDGFSSDSRSMLLFPVEGIQTLFIEAIINEFDESREGAEWFVYEGMDQIIHGGTEIDKMQIKSFDEYYKWLCNLKK